jgi:hypothetical protein
VSVSRGESEVGKVAGRVTDYCNVSGSRKQGLKNVGLYLILMLRVLKLIAIVTRSISMKTNCPRELPLPQDFRRLPDWLPQVNGTRFRVDSPYTAFQSGLAHLLMLSGIRCQSWVISKPSGGGEKSIVSIVFVSLRVYPFTASCRRGEFVLRCWD